LGDTFPAFWILIRPFLTSHCRAAIRQATGVMADLPARMEISTARSWIQPYTAARLLPDLLGNAALPGDGALGLKSCGSMKPKNLHPALDRMGADPKLLGYQFVTVPLFKVKLDDS
jgi:hypothetical protein